ncbi:unnamed protein product [Caretta caretta]
MPDAVEDSPSKRADSCSMQKGLAFGKCEVLWTDDPFDAVLHTFQGPSLLWRLCDDQKSQSKQGPSEADALSVLPALQHCQDTNLSKARVYSNK